VTIAPGHQSKDLEMKHDEIVDGEAMSQVEGNDVTYLLRSSPAADVDYLRTLGLNVVDMRGDPERAAFDSYRVAFRANASDPNLKHAVALVAAWNSLADLLGMDRV
jgi:hypothetical protein